MPLAEAAAPPMAMTAFDAANRVELDLGAIAHNTREIRRLVGPERRIVACLKSNAHGFGLMEVATTVLAAGADAVAIVSLGDAVCLREEGVSNPIMLYAGMIADERTAAVVDELELMPTVLDLNSAGIFSAQAKREVRCLVKVDVGLQRLGLDPREVVDFVRELVRLPRIVFHGLYTHMHVIGGAAAERYLDWQFHRFTDVVAALERAGLPPPLRLAASSSVLALSTAMNLNAIDPGTPVLRPASPDRGAGKLPVPAGLPPLVEPARAGEAGRASRVRRPRAVPRPRGTAHGYRADRAVGRHGGAVGGSCASARSPRAYPHAALSGAHPHRPD